MEDTIEMAAESLKVKRGDVNIGQRKCSFYNIFLSNSLFESTLFLFFLSTVFGHNRMVQNAFLEKLPLTNPHSAKPKATDNDNNIRTFTTYALK